MSRLALLTAISAGCLIACGCIAGKAAAGEVGETVKLQLKSGAVSLRPTTSMIKKKLPKRRRAPKGRARAGSEESAPVQEITEETAKKDEPIGSDHVILNFERRLQDAEFDALAKKGVRIWNYLDQNSYTATIKQKTVEQLYKATKFINKVRQVQEIDERVSAIKIDPSLASAMSSTRSPQTRGAGSGPEAAPIAVNVELWPDVDFEAAKAELGAVGTVGAVSPFTRSLHMTLAGPERIQELAANKRVKFIAKLLTPKAHNTHIRKNVGADVISQTQADLTGAGVRVGVFDVGSVARNHPAFRGRLDVDPAKCDEAPAMYPSGPHATHVAGTIAGNGDVGPIAVASVGKKGFDETLLPEFGDVAPRPADKPAPAPGDPQAAAATATELQAEPSDGRFPGIAPGARLMSCQADGASGKLASILSTRPNDLDVMNNSWGLDVNADNCDSLGAYDFDAITYDSVMSGRLVGQQIRRIPIVFAAGNMRDARAGSKPGGPGLCGMSNVAPFANYHTVTPPGTAKNVITIGAIDADTNEMATFSGYGPTLDGRIKPDVVAPGCRDHKIVSTFPETGLGRTCGTSQAAPVVSGGVALMMQKLQKAGFGKSAIYPSTYKAMLIHAAEDLGAAGPDYAFGYGRVRLVETLALIDQRAFRQAELKWEGDAATTSISVPSGVAELKVTLVWDDPSRDSLGASGLTNDLDLELISPDGSKVLPWVLNPEPGHEGEAATRGIDKANVVEQALALKPAPGAWRIAVKAARLGVSRWGQSYSVITTTK